MRLLSAVLCMLLLSAAVSAQSPRGQKHVEKTTSNRPPTVKLKLSADVATLPFICYKHVSENFPAGRSKVSVNTEASDPDNDALSYRYIVSGGRLSGSGPSVEWDLQGFTPGIYQISVTVDDKHGHKTSASASLELAACMTCDCPCTSVSLTGPDDSVEEGRPINIAVSLSGGDPDLDFSLLRYNWTVSAGKIRSGQGTDSIEIETGGVGETALIVTLKIKGLEPTCGSEVTREVKVHKAGEATRH